MFIIDTDGGVDDALCIAVASRLLPAAPIYSISYGNTSMVQAATNVASLLSKLGSKAQLLLGASCSADGRATDAAAVHGSDGMGGAIGLSTTPPAGAVSLESWLSQQNPGRADAAEPLRILGIGPATNVWRMVSELGVDRVADVTLMSGVLFDAGNISPFAEFNLFSDPLSFNRLVGCGVRLTIVPLDLCRKIVFPRSQLDRLDSFGPASTILKTAHAHYMDRYQAWEGIEGCFPHDTVALLVALFPDRFLSFGVTVEAETTGERRGALRTLEIGTAGRVRAVLGGDLKWVRGFFRFDDLTPKAVGQ